MTQDPKRLVYLINDEQDVFIDSQVSELIQKALDYSSDFMDLKQFAQTHDPQNLLTPIFDDLETIGYLLRAWRNGYVTKHSTAKILIDLGSQSVLLKKNPSPDQELGFRVGFLDARSKQALQDAGDSVYFTKKEIETINPKLLTFVDTDLDEMIKIQAPEQALRKKGE